MSFPHPTAFSRLKTCYRVLLLLLLSLVGACDSSNETSKSVVNPPASDSMALSRWLGGEVEARFERAIKPRDFIFPEDHGVHDSFKIEWWYITGNLSAVNNKAPISRDREFGYQVTFFRIGLASKSTPKPAKGSSAWASQNIWMAHVALSDISAKKHYQDERFSRGAIGLAGIQKKPFKVWLEDWQIVGVDKGEFPWQVSIRNTDFTLNLSLSPTKPVVLQGENGLSQKSPEAGNASYYYSFTRLKTEGEITTKEQQYNVKGWSWLDREWSSSALGKNQAGWNWFSLQLDDGTDVMFYQLHNKDGSTNPLSSGKWVDREGTYVSLKHHAVQLKPVKYWHSKTGKKYVVEWEMSLPGKHIKWRIKAMLDNQEMLTTVRYWEGAVRVFDARSGKSIGKGYLEMTGY